MARITARRHGPRMRARTLVDGPLEHIGLTTSKQPDTPLPAVSFSLTATTLDQRWWLTLDYGELCKLVDFVRASDFIRNMRRPKRS